MFTVLCILFLEYYEKAGVKFPLVAKIERGQEYDLGKLWLLHRLRWKIQLGPENFVRPERHLLQGGWPCGELAEGGNLDRGFILSDHADWDGLLEVIKGTEAEEIKVTHGNGDALTRYLQEQGYNCSVLEGAQIRGEEEE